MEPWIDGLWSAVHKLTGLSTTENSSTDCFNKIQDLISETAIITHTKASSDMEKGNGNNKMIDANAGGDVKEISEKEVPEEKKSNDCSDDHKWNTVSKELNGKGLICYILS